MRVDADDRGGARDARALHHVEADAAQAEHDDARARLEAGAVKVEIELAAGASFRFTATKQGRFAYICTLHPTMKGTLVVE